MVLIALREVEDVRHSRRRQRRKRAHSRIVCGKILLERVRITRANSVDDRMRAPEDVHQAILLRGADPRVQLPQD